MSGRRWLVVLVAVVAVALAAQSWRSYQRDQEWKHGGDDLEISGTVAVVPADSLPARTEVTVRWRGGTTTSGRLGFVLLDQRVDPSRPLNALEITVDGATRGIGWSGSYEPLADHYPWLERARSIQLSDGSYTDDMDGLFAPAHAEGSAVLRFARPGMRSDPASDLTLAVFAVDDDQVRCARQIPLDSSD